MACTVSVNAARNLQLEAPQSLIYVHVSICMPMHASMRVFVHMLVVMLVRAFLGSLVPTRHGYASIHISRSISVHVTLTINTRNLFSLGCHNCVGYNSVDQNCIDHDYYKHAKPLGSLGCHRGVAARTSQSRAPGQTKISAHMPTHMDVQVPRSHVHAHMKGYVDLHTRTPIRVPIHTAPRNAWQDASRLILHTCLCTHLLRIQ